MLLATINSSIILIALDIFRRIHLDPLTPANTNYLLRTTACLLVGWASVRQCPLSRPLDLSRGPIGARCLWEAESMRYDATARAGR
jgi:hypothetical protein